MSHHDAHHDGPDPDELPLTEPRSAPTGAATPENVRTDSETLGEASGGFLGAVGGMSIGAIGGPLGLLLGGLAGGVGGWWAGREVADALTEQDDAAFQALYATAPGRLADRDYAAVRPAYVAGHLAGRNPDYAARSFEEIEPELRRGWGDDVAARCGQWPAVRDYARAAFTRARGGG